MAFYEQEFTEEEIRNLEDMHEYAKSVYANLRDGEDIDNLEEELERIIEFEYEFEGDVGRHVEQIVSCSRILYDFTCYDEFEDILVEDVCSQLEEYDVEVDYNNLEDLEVDADPGVILAMNTVAEDGYKHGKQKKEDSEDYEMQASVEMGGEEIIIDIWDNGPGIPEEYKGKVFEKGSGDDNGLGMHLAKELLDSNDATINEEPENEQKEGGAGFRVELQPNTQPQNSRKAQTP